MAPMQARLDRVAQACAVLGGLLLLVVVFVVVASVVGRSTIGRGVAGDYEIVQIGAAVAVSLFLPVCQARGSNIIVDFFTLHASPALRSLLDRIGALLLGLIYAALAIRCAAGALDLKETGDTMMLLRFWPMWVGYALLVPGLLLASVVAFAQASSGIPLQHAHE